MPQRVTDLFYALMGLLAVAGLFLLGLNVYAATSRGPRWKRRLLGAGLALLAALGMVSCSDDPQPPPPPAGGGGEGTGVAPAGKDLEGSAEWRALSKTWKEAEEVASGKRGAYPFNAAGRKKLLASLEKATKDADKLAAAKLLSDAEAGLLKKDLAILTRRVRRYRATEDRMAMCYAPRPIPVPARDSAKRLADRLPLLEKLAAAGKLHKAAVEKVLVSIEKDLSTLDDEKRLKQLKATDRAKAEKTREAVKAQVKKIKARLSGGKKGASLENSKDWKTVLAAWKFAKPLATSGKSTTKQRKRATKELQAAAAAATRLAAAGLLTAAEAGLLTEEAAKVKADIYRSPPTDSMAKCYEAMAFRPAQASFARLKKRLPLLRKLVAGGKVNKAALDKVLATIEKDVELLSRDKHFAQLPDEQRPEAWQTRHAVKGHLEMVKVLLGDRPRPAAKLEVSKEWKTVLDAWKFAEPLATSGKSTVKQRAQANRKLQAARDAAHFLAAAGLLASAEARLLTIKADRINGDIYRTAPTDAPPLKVRGPTCYSAAPMVYTPPAGASFVRLQKRLPLLQKLVAGGKVNKAALDKILATIESDVKTLSDKKQLGKLSAAGRAKAKRTRDAVKAEIAKLKPLMKE